MPVRTQFGPGLKVLATGTATVNSTGGSNVDFGTPDDLYLPALAGFKSTDRLLVAVFAYKGTGTTSKLVVTVQDADDNSGDDYDDDYDDNEDDEDDDSLPDGIEGQLSQMDDDDLDDDVDEG